MAEMKATMPMHLLRRGQQIGDDVLALLHEAYERGHELGRVQGFEECRARVADVSLTMLVELDHEHDGITPAEVDDFERVYADYRPSPIVAAYYGAAADAIARLMDRVKDMDPTSGKR
jgi:hypothetical protein